MIVGADETTTKYVNAMRFGVTSTNFIMSVVFALILLVHAFTMEGITGNQVFHADRILQTFDLQNFPAVSLSTFIKQAYGADTEIIGMVDDTTGLKIPTMYEVSGSNSILRLEAVHCNFMLFSALWIASAFSLAMIQLPGYEPMYWSHARVVLVHIWNFIGLIATIVIFSSTTKWKSIPTSNLFYALIGQVMAWMYQYFHMVECTQLVTDTLSLDYKSANLDNFEDKSKSSQFSTELRKIMYMEASVVVPMLLVAGIMPGAIGIDEWRIQTVLFSSWTLFALLGLHLRFRKSLDIHHIPPPKLGPQQDPNFRFADNKAPAPEDAPTKHKTGLDAIGYLTYAIVVVYMMLINALEPVIFYEPPYATTPVIQSRWGARVLFLVAGCFVLETLVKSLQMRFLPLAFSRKSEVVGPTVEFVGNFLFVAFGSFLAKVFLFIGISNVNALTSWHL